MCKSRLLFHESKVFYGHRNQEIALLLVENTLSSRPVAYPICLRVFLAWAGLGKMPSAFGMLQCPTASIFGSVQFAHGL